MARLTRHGWSQAPTLPIPSMQRSATAEQATQMDCRSTAVSGDIHDVVCRHEDRSDADRGDYCDADSVAFFPRRQRQSVQSGGLANTHLVIIALRHML